MSTPASVQITRALVLTLSAGLAGWIIWRSHEAAQPQPAHTEAESNTTPPITETSPADDPYDPAKDPFYLFSSKSAAPPIPEPLLDTAQPEPSFLFSSKSAAPRLDPEPTFFPSSKVAVPPGGFLTPPETPKDSGKDAQSESSQDKSAPQRP
jgi:hypothetical protein